MFNSDKLVQKDNRFVALRDKLTSGYENYLKLTDNEKIRILDQVSRELREEANMPKPTDQISNLTIRRKLFPNG